MVFGMPQPGDPDRRPSAKPGDIWAEDEIAIVRAAILWLALREDVPDTGLKLEDIPMRWRLDRRDSPKSIEDSLYKIAHFTRLSTD
jgi:hypothetical protein